VNYNYRYRLRPSNVLEEQLAWTVDTCRQVYNHVLHRLNRTDDTSAYSEQKRLPSLKTWWNDLKHVHSKVLQKVVQRLYDNLSTLRGRKENATPWGRSNGKHRASTEVSPTVNPASSSKTRAVRHDCGSRNLEKFHPPSIVTFPTTPTSRPS
jgi:transposase